jgi:hypothetical protein
MLLGYLVGSNQTQESAKKEEEVQVERSSRRVVQTGGGGVRESSRKERFQIQRDRASELARTGESLGAVEEARLIHWILELEAGEFPDVLKTLSRIQGEDVDPFASRSTPQLMSIGLVR